jgi:hypothetical protein
MGDTHIGDGQSAIGNRFQIVDRTIGDRSAI